MDPTTSQVQKERERDTNMPNPAEEQQKTVDPRRRPSQVANVQKDATNKAEISLLDKFKIAIYEGASRASLKQEWQKARDELQKLKKERVDLENDPILGSYRKSLDERIKAKEVVVEQKAKIVGETGSKEIKALERAVHPLNMQEDQIMALQQREQDHMAEISRLKDLLASRDRQHETEFKLFKLQMDEQLSTLKQQLGEQADVSKQMFTRATKLEMEGLQLRQRLEETKRMHGNKRYLEHADLKGYINKFDEFKDNTSRDVREIRQDQLQGIRATAQLVEKIEAMEELTQSLPSQLDEIKSQKVTIDTARRALQQLPILSQRLHTEEQRNKKIEQIVQVLNMRYNSLSTDQLVKEFLAALAPKQADVTALKTRLSEVAAGFFTSFERLSAEMKRLDTNVQESSKSAGNRITHVGQTLESLQSRTIELERRYEKGRKAHETSTNNMALKAETEAIFKSFAAQVQKLETLTTQQAQELAIVTSSQQTSISLARNIEPVKDEIRYIKNTLDGIQTSSTPSTLITEVADVHSKIADLMARYENLSKELEIAKETAQHHFNDVEAQHEKLSAQCSSLHNAHDELRADFAHAANHFRKELDTAASDRENKPDYANASDRLRSSAERQSFAGNFQAPDSRMRSAAEPAETSVSTPSNEKSLAISVETARGSLGSSGMLDGKVLDDSLRKSGTKTLSDKKYSPMSTVQDKFLVRDPESDTIVVSRVCGQQDLVDLTGDDEEVDSLRAPQNHRVDRLSQSSQASVSRSKPVSLSSRKTSTPAPSSSPSTKASTYKVPRKRKRDDSQGTPTRQSSQRLTESDNDKIRSAKKKKYHMSTN